MKRQTQPIFAAASGKEIWLNRFAHLQKTILHWQVAFSVVLVICFLLVAGFVLLSLQSKIEPVVVETYQGIPTRLIPISENLNASQKLTQYLVSQYILNARSIVSDTGAQEALLQKVYAFSAEATLPFLRQYYQTNNPFTLGAQSATHIRLLSVIPISESSWQVTWEEESNPNGGLKKQQKWLATLMLREGKVNPHFVNENPFGLYVTNLSWSPLPEN